MKTNDDDLGQSSSIHRIHKVCVVAIFMNYDSLHTLSHGMRSNTVSDIVNHLSGTFTPNIG